MSKPKLTLAEASEGDVARIAEIHMAAFAKNQMLLAQFPTPDVRKGLLDTLQKKALQEISDQQWAVLVVRDKSGKIISYAKWIRPIPEDKLDEYVEAPWEWPDGTRLDVLEEWTAKVEAAGERLLGRTPHYSLTFIATDPDYTGRGAASLLVNWGLERGKEEKVPVALESTENAWEFYEKFGFECEETISMTLQGLNDGDADASVLYEEKCFLFRPNS